MNIGIVGIGYWGSNIVRVFDELKRENYYDGEVYLYRYKNSSRKGSCRRIWLQICEKF